MKKLEIVKIYDASNAHEAGHLVDKIVIFGLSLQDIYKCNQRTSVLEHLCQSKFRFKLEAAQLPFPYIAEFREAEEE